MSRTGSATATSPRRWFTPPSRTSVGRLDMRKRFFLTRLLQIMRVDGFIQKRQVLIRRGRTEVDRLTVELRVGGVAVEVRHPALIQISVLLQRITRSAPHLQVIIFQEREEDRAANGAELFAEIFGIADGSRALPDSRRFVSKGVGDGGGSLCVETLHDRPICG